MRYRRSRLPVIARSAWIRAFSRSFPGLRTKTLLSTWDSKWTFTSRLRTRRTRRAKALNPQQDTGNETVELDLVRYFNSLAGWLRGWAKLQEATSSGAKPVDGHRNSPNHRDTN